jgi:opacity protein-like surface antigen
MNRVFAAALVRPQYIAYGLGLLMSGTCHAQEAPQDDWYVAAAVTGSALNQPQQTIANAPTPGSTLRVTNDVDFGWGGQVEVGRSFGPVRVEAEVGRTTNKSKSYTATSPIQVTLPQKGTNNVWRYMGNAYFDLPQGNLPVRFFVGGGIGAARGHVTTFAAPARAPMAPPSQLMDFSQTVFAYQLMGGISLKMTSQLALTAQYRWFDAGTIKGRDSRGERATRDLAGSNIDVGLRFRF